MATNDFFSFPYVKNKMSDLHFSTPKEAVDEFRMHILEIPQSEWQKCFDNWFKRMILMGNILKNNKPIFDD